MMNDLAVALAQDLKARIEAWTASMIGPDGPCAGPADEFFSLLKSSANEGTDPQYLMWMCDQVVEKAQEWPATRLHRWVGYIQGCMVYGGISTLEDEKSAVRETKKTFFEG